MLKIHFIAKRRRKADELYTYRIRGRLLRAKRQDFRWTRTHSMKIALFRGDTHIKIGKRLVRLPTPTLGDTLFQIWTTSRRKSKKRVAKNVIVGHVSPIEIKVCYYDANPRLIAAAKRQRNNIRTRHVWGDLLRYSSDIAMLPAYPTKPAGVGIDPIAIFNHAAY